MEDPQLIDILVREHQLLMDDVRLFVRTRIDATTEEETSRFRARVLRYLEHAELASL